MEVEIESKKILKIDTFLRNYRDFSLSLSHFKLHHYKSRYQALFSGCHALNQTYKRINKHIAESFNIFSILNLDFKETIAHTPFLKTLLDPQGSHGQIDLFYNHFMKMVFNDSDRHNNFTLEKPEYYLVEEEKCIPRQLNVWRA